MKKIVNFKKWCPTCEWFGKESWQDPCNECLHWPAREDSRRPKEYQKQESLMNKEKSK